MKVQIIPMEEKHVNECFDLEYDCFGYKARIDKAMVYDRLRNLANYGVSFVAVYKKKVIGHITSFITRSGDIYIDYLCVEKQYRRKSIGKQLINKIEDENPRSNLFLRTGSNNQPAIKFYLSLNFEIHEVKGDDWKYRDILMVLKRK